MTQQALFVYGTLMTGGAQAGLLGRARRQPGRVHGALFRLPQGYPAMEVGGSAWVHGELVEQAITATMLAVLDQYEGVGEGLYTRQPVTVYTQLRRVTAWAWVMKAPHLRGGRRIVDGRWRTWRRG